jgi:hypothetical protein
MIRKHYALPVLDKGCNAIEVFHCDLIHLTLRVHGGTGTIVDGFVETDSFQPDMELQTLSLQVEWRDRFAYWYENHYTPNPADNGAQQFVSGLALYLWLQRRDELPPFVPE